MARAPDAAPQKGAAGESYKTRADKAPARLEANWETAVQPGPGPFNPLRQVKIEMKRGNEKNRKQVALDEIAAERIQTLFALATQRLKDRPEYARRYVSLARKIAMRHRLKIGAANYCKKCGTPLVPGVSARVRTDPKTREVVWACLHCRNPRARVFARAARARGTV